MLGALSVTSDRFTKCPVIGYCLANDLVVGAALEN